MPTFSVKDRRTYQNICHLTERGVLSIMNDILRKRYDADKIVSTPAFVYAIGDIPVALVAHADTVFKLPPALDQFYYDQERDVIWNPDGMGADDRAGIFAIIQILKKYNLRPHIVITTGEESGCIGSGKLIAHTQEFPAELKFMIQLDRRNRNDSVFYDCDNPKFEKFINKFGFKTEWGTFTDISILAPVWDVAAVNLSIGYEDEHHEIERLHVDWMYETIGKVVEILQYVEAHKDMDPFEYIPLYYTYTSYGAYGYRPRYIYGDGWYTDYDFDDVDYPITKAPTPGMAHCDWCHREVPVSQVLPVNYEHSLHDTHMCLECHDKVSHQVVWCKQCGKGYYLTPEKAKKVDLLNWICEDCNERTKHQKHSGSVQPSLVVLPGSDAGKPQNGSVVSAVAGAEAMVSGQHKNVNL